MPLMSQVEFAQHIGKTPGYITQLKDAGRLVMQGRMVDAEASKQRIDETQDPGKVGVTERHQTEREKKSFNSAQDMPAPKLDDIAGSAYQQARAMKEKYAAMQAKIAYEKEVGLLLVASEVKMSVADGDAIIRNRLESLPDMLAPQLAAESDEQKIRALLMDQIEHLLGELSQSFHKLTK